MAPKRKNQGGRRGKQKQQKVPQTNESVIVVNDESVPKRSRRSISQDERAMRAIAFVALSEEHGVGGTEVQELLQDASLVCYIYFCYIPLQ